MLRCNAQGLPVQQLLPRDEGAETMTIFVNDAAGKFVAQICLQSKDADSYCAEEPWLLLHNTGRTDRFTHQRDAKSEARKTWGKCKFEKSAL